MHSTLNPIISIDDISISYGTKDILSHISLDIFEGDICVIHGPSGSGKSTFLQIAAGMMMPQVGVVSYLSDEQYISTREGTFRHIYQERVGVFSTEALFFESNTIEDNLLFPHYFGGYTYTQDQFDMLVDAFEIRDILDQKIFQASSGERERVGIVRTFLYEPTILYLDEPFSHLDDRLFQEGMIFLRDYLSRDGITACIAAHNPIFTTLATRVYDMQDRKLMIHTS